VSVMPGGFEERGKEKKGGLIDEIEMKGEK